MFPFSKIYDLEKSFNAEHAFQFCTSEPENIGLAGILKISELKKFCVQFKIEKPRPNFFEIKGSITAIIVQESVVSFKPVTTSISEQFRIIAAKSEKAIPDLEILYPDDDIDVCDDNYFDIGLAAFEYLGVSIPLYPRLADESGDLTVGADDESLSPFAKLSDIKPKIEE